MTPEVIEGFRLSSQQKSAWRLSGKDPARHAVCAMLVDGRLEREILEEALRLLAERHEILRTTFHLLPGMTTPVQVISESLFPALRQANATDIEQLFAAERRIEFDYERGPLLRATLIPSVSEHHMIVLCMPALCADRMTMRNVTAELSDCYRAAAGFGKLSEAPMQYADYAEWQNELLQSDDEEAASARAFWRRTAKSFPTALLPFQVEDAQFRAASLSFPLEVDASVLNVSEDALLFTCWQILLGRLTGTTEICTAKLFTGRRFEELRRALGPFARYLPLATSFNEGLSFKECVARVDEMMRLAEEWQEYFEVDSEESVRFGFEYELAADEIYEVLGTSFTLLLESECAGPFDLHLSCVRTGSTLRASLQYNSAAFHAGDVERIAEQFQTLVADSITHPGRTIDRLEILSSSERLMLLDQVDVKDEPGCLQQMFEVHARENPDATALVFETERMSYQTLDHKANRLAHYLRDRGVGPEVCVGLCMKRSPELIVGMLGVLKAGGAYVPLDAEDPAGRRAHISAETGLRIILTQEHLRHLWSDFEGEVICLDFLLDGIDTSPLVSISPDNLAYLVHTSGSTGRPKGVLATHRGAVNYIRYLATEFPLRSSDVILQIVPSTFDASVREIFGALSAGATLVLPESKEPQALLSRIKASGVTALLSVAPTMLCALLDTARGLEPLTNVRLILSSGEPLPVAYCRRAREVFGEDVVVVNQYGPTECALTSSFFAVRGVLPTSGPIVPIGRPIRNRQLFLLDKHAQPVPFGVAGEVHIGGPGIARGYLRQPDLTAESFVPNPCSKVPGARLYCTGDLARHLRDGDLEFLGRIDNQVKLRGLRIEPGEIEAALTDHRGVKSAAVVMREDEPGNQRLVAYIVRSKGSVITVDKLREHLKTRLPEYMLPSTFVMLESMPLTPTGKVDRRALCVPEQLRPELSQHYVAPRTPVEEELTAIWTEILDIDCAGIHDNFFELGGHSLLAIQLVSRISEKFQVNLPMARLFEVATIAELALVVTQAQVEQEDAGDLAQILAELKDLEALESRAE